MNQWRCRRDTLALETAGYNKTCAGRIADCFAVVDGIGFGIPVRNTYNKSIDTHIGSANFAAIELVNRPLINPAAAGTTAPGQ